MSGTDTPVIRATDEVDTTTWAVLGDLNGADIEALAFLVLMQAAKSAQEDVKAIMAQVKKVNQEKQKLRELITDASVKALSSGRKELDERQLRTLLTYLMKPC